MKTNEALAGNGHRLFNQDVQISLKADEALAGNGHRLFNKDVQISLKANGIIQYKGDTATVLVHCKMRKALANVTKVLVNVVLVHWNVRGGEV